jgi:hypothetical protein
VITHVSAQALTWRGSYVRQRCAWCGAILIDEDLTRICVPVEQAGDPYPTWPPDALIETDGCVTAVVEMDVLEDGSVRMPDNACMKMPPELTVAVAASER